MTAGGRFRGSRPTIPLIARRTPAASAPIDVAGWVELTAPPTPFEDGNTPVAIVLDDGTILVGAGDPIASHFWIYDPGADTYTATATGPYALMDAGAKVGSYPYVASEVGAFARFDGSSWTTRAGRGGSANPTACSDGTYVYVLDGGAFRRFDPGGNSWSALTYPNVGASYSPMVCDGTSIWQFDRASGGSTTKYDIGAGTWDAGNVLTPPPTPRSFVGAAIIGSLAYLAGGSTGAFTASDVLEIYDLAGDSWTSGPAMGSGLSTAGAAVVSGSLYVFGTEGSPSFAPRARVYTP